MIPSDKFSKLKQILKEYRKVAICYSGGLDSTFLSKVAIDTLGKDNVLGCFVKIFAIPDWQYQQAIENAHAIDLKLTIINTNETDNPSFVKNFPDRCYHCKKQIYSEVIKTANSNGYTNILSADNLDDTNAYRPGMKANKELGIKSPLISAELKKCEIRELAASNSTPAPDAQSQTCLATRIPYYTEITLEKLQQIEDAENILRKNDLTNCRVRHLGQSARIEIPQEDITLFGNRNFRQQIVAQLKKIGFTYITLDLEGIRTGSMDEILSEESKNAE